MWATLRNHAGIGCALGIVAGWILLQILRSGTVGFALDDAYISLDLADNLWRTGVYGVNPGVVDSPSSSILWPFLLAPLTATPWPVAATLALTTLFALAATLTLARLGQALAGWTPNSWKGFAFVLVHVVVLNLPGLALIGLEHALQVWLTLLTALGIIRLLNDDTPTPPWWLWAAILLGPLVRYENLVISASALGIITWRGHGKGSALALLAIAVSLGAFSLFLWQHGLEPLPGSVVMKKWSHNMTFGEALGRRINFDMRMPFAAFLLVVTGVTTVLTLATLKHWRTVRWAMLASLAAAGLLHLLFGLYSGFNTPRYEISLVGWNLLLLYGLATRHPPRPAYKKLALLLLAPLLFQGGYFPIVDAPRMMQCLFQQQVQMRRFAVDFWRGPVAANDIGIVGFRNPSPVLDLLGLSDHDVRRLILNSHMWLDPDALLARRHVDLIMIYADWFPYARIRHLHPVGTLTSDACATTISVGGSAVTFFARTPEAADRLRPLLRDWGQTLPAGAFFKTTPP